MKWIVPLSVPEVAYFVDEIKEERLDGVPKITAVILGMYTAVEPNTFHVVIHRENQENLHDVFTSAFDAREFIEDHFIPPPKFIEGEV